MNNIVEIFIKAIDQTREGFESAAKNAASFEKAASIGAGAAIAGMTAAGIGLAALTEHAIENADAMGKLAQKAQVPVLEFSKLANAAKLADVPAEGLALAYKNLNKSIVDAVGNSQSAQAKAFSAMGISLQDQDGKLKTSTQVLLEFSDKFSQYADSANKGALAQDVFGKSAQDMTPLLNSGKDAIVQAMGEIDGISEEYAHNAENFNDNLTRLSTKFGELGNRIAEKVLPSLVQFTDLMLNSKDASDGFNTAAATTVDVLKYLVAGTMGAYTVFSMLGQVLIFIISSVLNVFISLIISAGNVIGFLVNVVGSLIRALGGLALAVGRVGEILYYFFSGDFSKAWESSKGAVADMKEAIVNLGVEVGIAAKENGKAAWESMKTAGANIKTNWDTLATGIEADAKRMTSVYDALFNPKSVVHSVSTNPDKTDAPHDNNNENLKQFEEWTRKRFDALNKIASLQRQIDAESMTGAEKVLADFTNKYEQRINIVENFANEGLITNEEAYDAELKAYVALQDQITKAARDGTLAREEMAELEKQGNIEKYIELSKMTVEQFLLQRGLYEQLNQLSSEQRQMSLQDSKEEFLSRQQFLSEYEQISHKAYSNIFTFASQMANGFQQGLSSSISGLLHGTMTLGQAFRNLGEAMLNSVINYVAEWLSAKVTMLALEAVFHATTIATNLATAATLAAAWATPAAFASIASFGGADVAATAGMAATVAFAKGLAVVGQAHDGLSYVPTTGTYLLQQGEEVLNKQERKERQEGGTGGMMEINLFLDGEHLGRALTKMVKSGRLNVRVAN